MDPPECSGHSHDHGDHGGDDLGLSLRPQIDFQAVQCLNEEIANAGRVILKLHEERLTTDPYLKSQDNDPELLLYIPFTETVTIQSISVRSVVRTSNDNDNDGVGEAAPPKTVLLFTNRDDLDFEMVRELEPQAKLELLPPYHFVEGTIDYPLRPAGRFQNISSLTMYFKDNYGSSGGCEDEEEQTSTIITFVGLKGKGTKIKRMAVETVYESQPMPEEHAVAGFAPAARESC